MPINRRAVFEVGDHIRVITISGPRFGETVMLTIAIMNTAKISLLDDLSAAVGDKRAVYFARVLLGKENYQFAVRFGNGFPQESTTRSPTRSGLAKGGA